MSAFPAISSGAIAMYPLRLTDSRGTTICQFVNGGEQRWRSRAALASFTLSFTNIDGYDLGIVLDFWRQQKGRFVDAALTNTFSLTLPINGSPQTWDYLVIDQDEFNPVESDPNRFSFTIKLKQVRRT